MVSQTVLLKGVNDDVETLEALMRGFVEIAGETLLPAPSRSRAGHSHLRLTIAEGQALMRGAARAASAASRCRPTCWTFPRARKNPDRAGLSRRRGAGLCRERPRRRPRPPIPTSADSAWRLRPSAPRMRGSALSPAPPATRRWARRRTPAARPCRRARHKRGRRRRRTAPSNLCAAQFSGSHTKDSLNGLPSMVTGVNAPAAPS